MTTSRTPEGDGMAGQTAGFRGNDRVLFGIVPGVLTFGLFPQTTLNIPPDVVHDVGLGASMMNTAVAMTALFSGIFTVAIRRPCRPHGPCSRRADLFL